MMGRILLSEWTKVKRTWVVPLVFLGPFGVVSLNALRYMLAYHRLVVPGVNNWGTLVGFINSLLIPALVLGISVLASLMAGMEHNGHMWKQLLALPAPRASLYAAKFICLLVFIAVSAALAAVGTIILGLTLGFGPSVPWALVLQEGFAPYLAACGILAIQMALSVLIANQTVAIMTGVSGVIVSFASGLLPSWLPWIYPAGASPVSKVSPSGITEPQFILYGLSIGIIVFAIAAALFQRREVN